MCFLKNVLRVRMKLLYVHTPFSNRDLMKVTLLPRYPVNTEPTGIGPAQPRLPHTDPGGELSTAQIDEAYVRAPQDLSSHHVFP